MSEFQIFCGTFLNFQKQFFERANYNHYFSPIIFSSGFNGAQPSFSKYLISYEHHYYHHLLVRCLGQTYVTLLCVQISLFAQDSGDCVQIHVGLLKKEHFFKPTNRKLSTFKQTHGPVDSSNMMFKLIRKSIEKVYLKYNKGFYCFFFIFLGY